MKRILAAVALIGALVTIPLFAQTEKPAAAPDSAKKNEPPKDKDKTAPSGPSSQPKAPVLRRQVGWEYKVHFSAFPTGDPSENANKATKEFNAAMGEGWDYAGTLYQQASQQGTYVLLRKARYVEMKMPAPKSTTPPPPLVPKADTKSETKKP
jgi:hypothetical protein